jgi:D-threo-aldose 1-dehydrogenase
MTTANTDRLARRRFGSTDIMVPPISIGCAPIGNMPDAFAYGVTEEDALATIRAALASPIDYLDTAALYGDGESERRIGLVLKELGGLPSGSVLQTKAGRDPRDNNYRPDTVKWRFERSLKLLGVDAVDICFLHDAEWTTFEEAMAPGGVVEVLQGYRNAGQIKHLGVASGPTPLEIQYVETGVFDAVITHNRYTLLNRDADPLLDVAHKRGLAVLNAAPYGSGMLAKGISAYPRYAYQTASQEMIDLTRRYEDVCQRHGVSLPAVALQFSTRDPRITSTIVGMSRPERIQQTIDYLLEEVPQAVWDEVAELPFDRDDPEKNRWS